MIAACGTDDVLGQITALFQGFKISQPAANFEGADGCVVFVLDPAVRAQPIRRHRPAILRRGLKVLVHHTGCRFNLFQGEH